jgi:hypothetical protein
VTTGEADGTPIFIVGCGRSGTSLLRRLLNQHPLIGIPLESLFIVDYLQASSRIPVERMAGMLVREPELREWGIHPTRADLQGSATAAEAIDRLHRLYLAPRGKGRWGQKTPRFVRHLPLLRTHFPDARFIHLVRDPRAVAASLIRSNVHRSTAYYGARRWRMDVDFGLAFEQQAPEAVQRIAYEELVSTPEAALRRLCAFCGLDFDPAMLAPPRGEVAEYSSFYADIHAHVDRPATSDFVDRWSRDLTPEQVAQIEAVAGERMDKLGYPRTALAAAELPSSSQLRRERLAGLSQQLVRYLRFRPRYLTFLLYRKARLGLLKSFLWSVNY